MRYYISDLHFFHDALNTAMDRRGFSTQEEMHRYMIERWNSRVSDKDEVVILGDFSVGKAEETEEILRQLKGKKCLIIGNHDKFLNNKKFHRHLFKWIEPYYELKEDKKLIVLSHYPIFCYHGQNRMTDLGEPRAMMLYGHLHDTFDEVLVNDYIFDTRSRMRPTIDGERRIPCHMINCFCMFSDYVPLTLEEWIRLDEERREKRKDKK